MKQLILIVVLFQSSLAQSQGTYTWPADTLFSERGDTIFLDPVTFEPISRVKYFDSQGNLTQSYTLIPPDTVRIDIY
jgi:hypothetical protein